MKKMRRLIPAIAMLLVSAVMLSTASFAWFTIGTQANATGMTVTASSASSLLIVDEAAQGTVQAKFDAADNTIEFAAITGALKPATKADATHTSDVGLMKPTDTNLKTETESGVDHLTGAYNGTYDALDATAEGEYYIEYVAYIATAGAAMVDYHLNVGVDFADEYLPVYNATTIDFLVKSSSKNTDAAVLKATRNALTGDTGNTPIDLGVYTIPVAPATPAEGQTDTGDYITVIMRVYVDGALKDSTKGGEYTYVRNSQIDLNGSGFSFNVVFTADKAETTTEQPSA